MSNKIFIRWSYTAFPERLIHCQKKPKNPLFLTHIIAGRRLGLVSGYTFDSRLNHATHLTDRKEQNLEFGNRIVT